ncbi:uncharacterized protein C7orf50 homolog isoform X1 [Sapajus apella]|uniref:Uncharacterized protein C7orf50 homolog isoform X1 n=1 Tax=Sapajus apella TaxID=9515 RepID=A0A6J3GED5_SAPAP|nr:uncharacterized protein C7orf50 homolog isoform X1 [Sapajus apella]XP_032115768.1 uncharacterized protein C7orf50 homolog isoform X1 [Sapajus apella]
MAKQKRKVPEVMEKKNKKLKKASAEGPLLVPEAMPDGDGAGPQGGAVLRTVQDAEPELSPEEQSVLERKLKKKRKKKERQRLREAGVVAQQPPARRSGAELALDYLCRWAQKHENWRFQKTRQTWLLLHMYDSDKGPEAPVRRFTSGQQAYTEVPPPPADKGQAATRCHPAAATQSRKVPDEHFSTLLAYLEGLRGQARELTVQKAEALMRELDEDGVGGPNPLLPGRAQRIRQVLQLLS